MPFEIVSRYSDIKEMPINWLWYPYIPIGKITLLQGDPGDGKSSMMMSIIAQLTIGGTAPDGTHFGEPKRVIYQCSEDDVSDTIKPRLQKNGADCSMVAFLDEEQLGSITLNDERLRDAIKEFRPSLVVVDPIQSYLGNDVDIHIAGKARKVMHQLSLWASTYDCAVVLIGHLNKKEGSKNLYRGLGSIDITATARSVLQIERDAENELYRILSQVKNNLGPFGQKLCFYIDAEKGVCWKTNGIVDNSKMLATDKIETQTDKAAFLIKQYLQDKDMLSQEIRELLRNEGISYRTIDNVKDCLGICSYRKKRKWYWSLCYKKGNETE